MTIQVLMPQLGESVTEGTLTRWLKSVGDSVDEFEALVEINTDKVDTEVPSPASGVLLETLVPEGTVVQAGTLLALIGEAGEKPVIKETEEKKIGAQFVEAPGSERSIPDASLKLDHDKIKAAESESGGRQLGFLSPVVRKMAREYHIDLTQLSGTGQGGRITKKDVEQYLAKHQVESRTEPPVPSVEPSLKPFPTQAPISAYQAAEGDILMPLSTLRKQIAEHMLRSKHSSPHVTTIMEVDLARVITHRQANKESFARDGVNLTFTAYFASAAATALKAYPLVNSSWDEAGIRLHHEVNIGVAVSLGEAGLIVPVIKNADRLSLLGIARSVNDLADRARQRQLMPDDVQGGTFTITNHGISGSLFATPIINQPQSAILGVGAIQKRPVVISDELHGDMIAIRTMAYIGLTFDHRILDGAIADQFLATVVNTLKDWP